MIKIYGVVFSRTARCLWMLEELGLPYDLIAVNHRMDEQKTEDYASLNPNMHVPTLVDGDLVLWESIAINLYLADKYGGGLKPGNDEERGKTYQWMFWGLTEAETLLLTVLRHGKMYPEEHRDPRKAEEAEAALQKPLGILDQALAGRKFLVSENFSVADLNLSFSVSWGLRGGLDFSNFPNVKRWLEDCLNRPSRERVHALRGDPSTERYKPGWKWE